MKVLHLEPTAALLCCGRERDPRDERQVRAEAAAPTSTGFRKRPRGCIGLLLAQAGGRAAGPEDQCSERADSGTYAIAVAAPSPSSTNHQWIAAVSFTDPRTCFCRGPPRHPLSTEPRAVCRCSESGAPDINRAVLWEAQAHILIASGQQHSSLKRASFVLHE